MSRKTPLGKLDSKCPVTRGEVNLAAYAAKDGEWRVLGLAAPARRALVNANLLRLADLKKVSENQLMSLHGMGRSALKVIRAAMAAKSILFRA